MQQIRKRLTYANVISTVALFLVLGGASALAAGHLAKNSVGTKQLKNNAVTAAKIKNGAITGAKLNLGSLGQVPSAASAAHATDAVHATSADRAATADHAASADHAATADQAASAGNADTVGGEKVQRISWTAPKGTPTTTIFSADGLTITGSCSGGGELTVLASTTANDAELQVFGNVANSFFNSENSHFTTAASIINGTGFKEGAGSLAYGTASGSVVTITYGFDFHPSFNGTSGCAFFGQAIAS